MKVHIFECNPGSMPVYHAIADAAFEGLVGRRRLTGVDLKSQNQTTLMAVTPTSLTVVGVAHLRGVSSYTQDSGAWHLDELAVLPKHQRCGFGSSLLHHAISVCKYKHDAESVSLYVRRDNTSAIKLYKRYGFVKVGVQHNAYCKGIHADHMKLVF